MVLVVAWCAVPRCIHAAHGIARAPTNSSLSAFVTSSRRPTCSSFGMSSNAAEQ